MADLLEIYKSKEWKYEDYKSLAVEAKDDIEFIRSSIYNQALSDSDLNLINSPSKDALWNMWADIYAYISWILHSLWIDYEQRLNTAAAAVIPHTAYWYNLKAKEFQYGDSLIVQDGVVKYATINSSNQIVAASAVKENEGKLILKVAKAAVSGLEPLDSNELTSFTGYINSIRDAGVSILIVSQNADLLKLDLTVYYDPIRPLPIFKFLIEKAIKDYLLNLSFDGTFRRTKLVDTLQVIEGVVDVKIHACEATVAYISSPTFNVVDVFYETAAGYMNIDSNYPLSTAITYIANV